MTLPPPNPGQCLGEGRSSAAERIYKPTAYCDDSPNDTDRHGHDAHERRVTTRTWEQAKRPLLVGPKTLSSACGHPSTAVPMSHGCLSRYFSFPLPDDAQALATGRAIGGVPHYPRAAGLPQSYYIAGGPFLIHLMYVHTSYIIHLILFTRPMYFSIWMFLKSRDTYTRYNYSNCRLLYKVYM